MTNRAQSEITHDTPLRLADAVKIAFPMGGMTVSGLRKEIRRKRLTVEVMAGKQFTTLADPSVVNAIRDALPQHKDSE